MYLSEMFTKRVRRSSSPYRRSRKTSTSEDRSKSRSSERKSYRPKSTKRRKRLERSSSKSTERCRSKSSKIKRKEKLRTVSRSPERHGKISSASRHLTTEKRKGAKRKISRSPEKYKRQSRSSSGSYSSPMRNCRRSRSRKKYKSKSPEKRKKSRKGSKKRRKSIKTSESSPTSSPRVKKIKKEKDSKKPSPRGNPPSPEYRPCSPTKSPEHWSSSQTRYAQYGPSSPPRSPEYRQSTVPVSGSSRSHNSPGYRPCGSNIYETKTGHDLSTSQMDLIRNSSKKKRLSDKSRGIPERERGVCSPPIEVKLKKSKKHRADESIKNGPDPFNLKSLEVWPMKSPYSKSKSRQPSAAFALRARSPSPRSILKSDRASRDVSPANRAYSSPNNSALQAKGITPFKTRASRDLSQSSSQSVSVVAGIETQFGSPSIPKVEIKQEVDIDENGMVILPPVDVTAGKGIYFKPDRRQNAERPGYARCHICESNYENYDINKRNLHLQQHLLQVFIVKIPQDILVYDIEEVIAHYAKLGVNNGDIADKMFKNKLATYPRIVEAFTCSKCPEGRRFTDYSSLDECRQHIREYCKVSNKENVDQYVISWCRGCHTQYESVEELFQHLQYNQDLNYINKETNNIRHCFPKKSLILDIYNAVKGKPMSQVTQSDPAIKKELVASEKELVASEKELVASEKELGGSENEILVNKKIKKELMAIPSEFQEVLGGHTDRAIDPYKNFNENLDGQSTADQQFDIFSDLEVPSQVEEPSRSRNLSASDLQNILANVVPASTRSAVRQTSYRQFPDVSRPPPGYSVHSENLSGPPPGYPLHPQTCPRLSIDSVPMLHYPATGAYSIQQSATDYNHPSTDAIYHSSTDVYSQHHSSSLSPPCPDMYSSTFNPSKATLPASLGPSHPGYHDAPAGLFPVSKPTSNSKVDTAIQRIKKEVLVKREPQLSAMIESQIESSDHAPRRSLSRMTPSPTYSGYLSPTSTSPTLPAPITKTNLCFKPPPPSAPLPSMDALFSEAPLELPSSSPSPSGCEPTPAASPFYNDASAPSQDEDFVAAFPDRPTSSCYSRGSEESTELSPVRIVNEECCRTSSCHWDDRHSGECSKPAIKIRCANETCDEKDLHQTYCPKLNKYCNNDREVKKIPLECRGVKDTTNLERRQISWRLLYHTRSRVLSDPRINLESSYPRRIPDPLPERTLNLLVIKSTDGQPKGVNFMVYPWSCLPTTKLLFNHNNPHAVVESDDEIEVEYEGPKVTDLEFNRPASSSSVEEEVQSLDEVKLARKARQYRKKPSVEDGEILCSDNEQT